MNSNKNKAKTIHGVRSWCSNFYWTSICLVFKQLGEERIKNWSYNHMLYKTVAKLLYKLRCEDYNTQVNPTNLCHRPDFTSNPTREPPANSQLQSIQWKDQPSLQHMMTRTTNTSKKAMDNPASTAEKTYTEEGVTATPPDNTIPHNQAPHSPFTYSGMMVPYVEGPKMKWTVDDALHSRFLRWRIKCENILDCQLAILQENAKCKQQIQWSGDAGLGVYISWNLPKEEITLQTIWSWFEDFCKPQSNEVCAKFDLLTTFQQGNRCIDEWYNAVLAHIPLCEYPKETAAILTRGIFWFFMADNEFIAKLLTKATPTLSNTQLPKCNRWPRSLNLAKPLQNTLNSIHPVCKVLLKWMSYHITVPVYHPRRKRQ